MKEANSVLRPSFQFDSEVRLQTSTAGHSFVQPAASSPRCKIASIVLTYQGSYNRMAAFARAWHARRHEVQQTTGQGTFVPLAFGPSEAFQFDWSEDWAVFGGERAKLQIAHFKLSHSRAFLVRAYPLQTHEIQFDAHNRAFEVFSGVRRRGIYDKMKTAVDRVRRGKERNVSAMVSHYLFEAEFCNPARWSPVEITRPERVGHGEVSIKLSGNLAAFESASVAFSRRPHAGCIASIDAQGLATCVIGDPHGDEHSEKEENGPVIATYSGKVLPGITYPPTTGVIDKLWAAAVP